MTVLVVDDQPLVQALVETVLKDNGLAVLTADCAEQAFSVFREHSEDVDLLITDVEMPGLDGLSLSAALRARRPHLKVLLMSGFWSSEQLPRDFEFLAKPFSIGDLLTKVFSLLDAHGRRRSARGQMGITKVANLTAAAGR